MNDNPCPAFKAELQRFMDEHGCRCASGMELQPSYPAWKDEPDNVLSMVHAFVQHTEGLVEDEKERANEYNRIRAEIVQILKKPKWIESFEWALDMTRGFWIAREATLYMYEEIVALLRDCAERLAARLVTEGKIRHARDLYYLSVNELEDLIDGKQAEALSQGEAEGVVKVIRGPQEFHKLKPGDILVCTNTNLAWTPLFSVAAAVVIDTGGVLSHSAIVHCSKRIRYPRCHGMRKCHQSPR